MRDDHADWEALREELDWDDADADAETEADEVTVDEPRMAVTPKP